MEELTFLSNINGSIDAVNMEVPEIGHEEEDLEPTLFDIAE